MSINLGIHVRMPDKTIKKWDGSRVWDSVSTGHLILPLPFKHVLHTRYKYNWNFQRLYTFGNILLYFIYRKCLLGSRLFIHFMKSTVQLSLKHLTIKSFSPIENLEFLLLRHTFHKTKHKAAKESLWRIKERGRKYIRECENIGTKLHENDLNFWTSLGNLTDQNRYLWAVSKSWIFNVNIVATTHKIWHWILQYKLAAVRKQRAIVLCTEI